MLRHLMRRLLPVVLLSGSAVAADLPPTHAADPAQAQARVAPLRHASALAGSRRHADAAPIAWKDANASVAHIGGWRSYAREAAEAAPAASAPSAGAKR